MFEREYKKLMRRCNALAKKSEGHTSPNPLVGAIIFDDNFRIISEGRHEYYGGNHAERNAVLSAKEDLKGKSIIVNLEYVNKDVARRIVDVVCGAVKALDGNMEKVSNSIFVNKLVVLDCTVANA